MMNGGSKEETIASKKGGGIKGNPKFAIDQGGTKSKKKRPEPKSGVGKCYGICCVGGKIWGKRDVLLDAKKKKEREVKHSSQAQLTGKKNRPPNAAKRGWTRKKGKGVRGTFQEIFKHRQGSVSRLEQKPGKGGAPQRAGPARHRGMEEREKKKWGRRPEA